MSLFQSTVALFYLNSLVVNISPFTFATNASITEMSEVPEESEIAKDSNLYNIIMSAFRQRVNVEDIDSEQKDSRVKKAAPERFTEAASLTPIKLLHLFVMFFKNILMDKPSKGERRLNATEAGRRMAAVYNYHMQYIKGLNSEWLKAHPTKDPLRDDQSSAD